MSSTIKKLINSKQHLLACPYSQLGYGLLTALFIIAALTSKVQADDLSVAVVDGGTTRAQNANDTLKIRGDDSGGGANPDLLIQGFEDDASSTLDNKAIIGTDSSVDQVVRVHNFDSSGRLDLVVEGDITTERKLIVENLTELNSTATVLGKFNAKDDIRARKLIVNYEESGHDFEQVADNGQSIIRFDSSSTANSSTVKMNIESISLPRLPALPPELDSNELYRKRASGISASEYYVLWNAALCPRIDAWIDGRWKTVGRAIKNNNGFENRGLHVIHLPFPVRKFRLVEDEPEVSRLSIKSAEGELWSLGEELTTEPGGVYFFEFREPTRRLDTTGYYEVIE